MEFVCVHMNVKDAEQAERLIALLGELPLEGFEEKEQSLDLYMNASDFDQSRLEEILKTEMVDFSLSKIEKTNWNQNWESHYEAVRIPHPQTGSPYVHIRASFHPSLPDTPFEILINPKMSFGTGHHATTFLMIQEMSSLNWQGKTVIDFGTGTGILSVMAEMLGAREILAIDNDTWSVENSAENIRINHCRKISLELGDRIPAGQMADIMLANINLNVIRDNFGSILNSMNPDGELIFSGILHSDEDEIMTMAVNNGLAIVNCCRKDAWSLIHCKSMIT